jgi:hypothetical protein
MRLFTLVGVPLVTIVTGCVIELAYVYPAYRRTKCVGLLLWCISAAAALVSILLMYTFGISPRTSPGWHAIIVDIERICFLLDVTAGTIGSVLVVKSYLELFGTNPLATPTSEAGHV